MSDVVRIQIRKSVYAKLQQLAVLSGDTSSAIERLIAHWEGQSQVAAPKDIATPKKDLEIWVSPSGDPLPVGVLLRGTDMGKPHEATVVRDGIKYNGTIYPSPSAAASAVKQARGLKGPSANTDGRKFWRLRDPKTNRWVPLNSLRPAQGVAEMLKELDSL